MVNVTALHKSSHAVLLIANLVQHLLRSGFLIRSSDLTKQDMANCLGRLCLVAFG